MKCADGDTGSSRWVTPTVYTCKAMCGKARVVTVERVGDGRVDSATARRVDVAIAAGLWVLSVSLILGVIDGGGRRAAAIGLAFAHIAPLAWRRRRPEAVLAAMAVTGLAFVATGSSVVGLGPAILVGVYSAAAYRPPARSLPAVGAAIAAMLVAVAASGAGPDTMLADAIAFAVAWLVGDRQRRAVADADIERARAVELARTREQLARQAVIQERLRIARELHDIVAHAMSVITVQAGTARMVMDGSPDVARDALGAIEGMSRQALQEMRRLLSVLRDDTGGAADALLAPARGLADLDALVETTGASGLRVELCRHGDPVDLPAGADLAAYRIVQEALTNVCRHARASSASVVVRYRPSEVAVEVTDDGVGGVPRRDGHGIVGMRERAALYGGDVEAAPRPEGGFRVRARIPVESG
jgi:signal transduction histidine kinase